MCMYVCVCVCYNIMHVRAFMYTRMCMSVYTCTCVHMRACVLCMYVCVFVCVRACMHVVCAYVKLQYQNLIIS